jgi:hypothetical protein
MAGQIATRLVTILEIMSDPKFALGVADARAGRGFPADYDRWSSGAWSYERGRAWALLTPRSVALKAKNGEVAAEALLWFRRLDEDIL